jgi:hypothetical protein
MLQQAPVFYPSKEEFESPLDYIESIREHAEKFGICKIVPADGWRPPFSPPRSKFPTKLQRLDQLSGRRRLSAAFYLRLRMFYFVLSRRNEGSPLHAKEMPPAAVSSSGEAVEWLELYVMGREKQLIADSDLRGQYETFVRPFSDAEKEGNLPPLPPPPVPSHRRNKTSSSKDVMTVGDTFWRFFAADDRCLWGKVVRLTPNGLGRVDYYTGPPARTSSRDRGKRKSDMEKQAPHEWVSSETMNRSTLSNLVLNGADERQAKLAFTGSICEDCCLADASKRMLTCAVCKSRFHPKCVGLSLSDVSMEYFCGGCLAFEVGGGWAWSAAGRKASSNAGAGVSNNQKNKGFGFEDGGTFTMESFQSQAREWQRKYVPRLATEKRLEEEFWRLVSGGGSAGIPGDTDVAAVLYGSDLDTSVVGSGFPTPADAAQMVGSVHGKCTAEEVTPEGAMQSVPASESKRRRTVGRKEEPKEEKGPEEETKIRRYETDPWNLTRLPLARNSLLKYLGKHITGVMVPWLYMGSCYSAFCWHTEDHFLYSINYLHEGAAKRWYGVPGSAATKFEAAMHALQPELFAASPDLLQQLVTMASPDDLLAKRVPVSMLTQRENEFVITFPRAYHAGFNLGPNCAEAVNFAPPDWLSWGHVAQERYRADSRTPIFSHEALVMKMARSLLEPPAPEQDPLDDQDPEPLRLLPVLLGEVGGMAGRQRDCYASARSLGIKNFKSISKFLEKNESLNRSRASRGAEDTHLPLPQGGSDCNPTEGPRCSVCLQYCFLAAVVCENCCDARHFRCVCPTHALQACSKCPVEDYTFLYHSSEDDLIQLCKSLRRLITIAEKRAVDASRLVTRCGVDSWSQRPTVQEIETAMQESLPLKPHSDLVRLSRAAQEWSRLREKSPLSLDEALSILKAGIALPVCLQEELQLFASELVLSISMRKSMRALMALPPSLSPPMFEYLCGCIGVPPHPPAQAAQPAQADEVTRRRSRRESASGVSRAVAALKGTTSSSDPSAGRETAPLTVTGSFEMHAWKLERDQLPVANQLLKRSGSHIAVPERDVLIKALSVLNPSGGRQ